MKGLFALFLIILSIDAYGYDVCSTNVAGMEYSYTEVMPADDLGIANWAVGSGCDGAITNIDIPAMCSGVVAGGQGFCAASTWLTGAGFDEMAATIGSYCWCRRTHMLVGNDLIESIGQWVMLGLLSGKCQQECAKYCAMNVAENAGGLRNAIMLLPAS